MSDIDKMVTEGFWAAGYDEEAGRRAALKLVAEHDRQVKAEAWGEGHRHPWVRGFDDCTCGAWAAIECACGRYGTGELLSLNDNPYRKADNA